MAKLLLILIMSGALADTLAGTALIVGGRLVAARRTIDAPPEIDVAA